MSGALVPSSETCRRSDDTSSWGVTRKGIVQPGSIALCDRWENDRLEVLTFGQNMDLFREWKKQIKRLLTTERGKAAGSFRSGQER